MPLPTLMTAHQGGWDEILLVAGPVAGIAGRLWLADRRPRRMGPPDGSNRSDESGAAER